jgi:hypothetical protein
MESAIISNRFFLKNKLEEPIGGGLNQINEKQPRLGSDLCKTAVYSQQKSVLRKPNVI